MLDKYNVYENVALPLKLQNIKDYDTKVLEVLEKVGIKDLKDRKINEKNLDFNYYYLYNTNCVKIYICGYGGTGRRARLRI